MQPSPLEQLLDEYGVRYRNRRGEQDIRCPVHDDAHASATLNLNKGLWHCLACGAGGGAVQLVMAKEGLSYAEASRRLPDGGSGRGGRVEAEAPGPGYKPRYRRGRDRPRFGR